jgi:hypothetical protein
VCHRHGIHSKARSRGWASFLEGLSTQRSSIAQSSSSLFTIESSSAAFASAREWIAGYWIQVPSGLIPNWFLSATDLGSPLNPPLVGDFKPEKLRILKVPQHGGFRGQRICSMNKLIWYQRLIQSAWADFRPLARNSFAGGIAKSIAKIPQSK